MLDSVFGYSAVFHGGFDGSRACLAANCVTIIKRLSGDVAMH